MCELSEKTQNIILERYSKNGASFNRNCVRVICGYLPNTTILPVGNRCGFLSECEENAALKFNSSFFIMDRFDCASAYDSIGTVTGLLVKDGFVSSPPMYMREALT